MTELTKELVEAVEAAFRAECGVGGVEIIELESQTNACLRAAWPFVMMALNGHSVRA